jgi:hypothetical protein
MIYSQQKKAASVRWQSALILVVIAFLGCSRQTDTIPPIPTNDVTKVDPWKLAVDKVEKDRGEPMGRNARTEVPVQLKHYADSRRFLGIQVAEWREHNIRTPRDFVELVGFVQRGELVEVPALGQGYILYGVGMNSNDEPFTHYDKATKKSIPLYGSDADLQQEFNRIAETIKQYDETIKGLKEELKKLRRRDREQRTKLQSDISENENARGALRNTEKLLKDAYSDSKMRATLFSEFETIAAFARSSNPPFDLNDPDSRKALKIKLLSCLRPVALRVLESLSQRYEAQFARPLPVSSLTRTEEYQRRLHASNRNATLIDVPPHSTGLAFDLFYRYMSAAEQNFLMNELAKLFDEGRIEVLRESNNNYHVFVFTSGHRPDEKSIEESLEVVGPEPVKEKPVRRHARARRRR